MQRTALNDQGYLRLTYDSLHDLAGPVNQIRTMTDLILQKHGGALDDDGRKMLGLLQNSAMRLQNLLGGLQSYWQAVSSPDSHETADSGALVSAAIAQIQESIERSGAAITRGSLPVIYCDAAQITRIFQSLLENAIKFAGKDRPEIHVTAVIQDELFLFSVRDNGIGIDPRYHDRIFSAFKRLHADTYSGAGVGLAISRQIVEQHGGRIWVESELGNGATFFFTLPKQGAQPS
jgi:light-regulated signal transduction histidine kinase (bacteriophytochrome)